MTVSVRSNTVSEVDRGDRRLTAADLAAMPADLPSGPVLYELYEGELRLMTPPGGEHGSVESQITYLLVAFGKMRGLGQSYGEVGIQLSSNPDTVVGADAAFILQDQFPVRMTPEGWLATIPALVVEVVSKNDSAPAVRRKVDLYLNAGVRLVWVVNPKTRTVTLHRRDSAPRVLTSVDTLSEPEMLPGLSYPVARLFE
ncbi:MAG TPA: Uma2 family endonuclease [Armatimonadota bacterium]|nr:Uma2 family endonuclease [Armatimonadota bacterium]